MLSKSITSQIRSIIRKYLPDPDYRIFLFGSRATSDNRKFSDIDIALSAPTPLPGYLKVKISEELENSRIPYKIDLVDLPSVSATFKPTALKHAIPL